MITKDEYINLFNFINKRFSELIENIDLRELENKKNNLEKESQESDFWNDNAKAKKVLKLISNIEKELLEYKNLEIYHEEVSDDLELINLGEEINEEIINRINKFQDLFDRYETKKMLNANLNLLSFKISISLSPKVLILPYG